MTAALESKIYWLMLHWIANRYKKQSPKVLRDFKGRVLLRVDSQVNSTFTQNIYIIVSTFIKIHYMFRH